MADETFFESLKEYMNNHLIYKDYLTPERENEKGRQEDFKLILNQLEYYGYFLNGIPLEDREEPIAEIVAWSFNYAGYLNRLRGYGKSVSKRPSDEIKSNIKLLQAVEEMIIKNFLPNGWDKLENADALLYAATLGIARSGLDLVSYLKTTRALIHDLEAGEFKTFDIDYYYDRDRSPQKELHPPTKKDLEKMLIALCKQYSIKKYSDPIRALLGQLPE